MLRTVIVCALEFLRKFEGDYNFSSSYNDRITLHAIPIHTLGSSLFFKLFLLLSQLMQFFSTFKFENEYIECFNYAERE